MTTTTHVDTNDQPLDLAQRLNDLQRAGRLVSVNGHEVKPITQRHDVATAWGNGSVSVRVKARQAGKTNDHWIKLGASVEIVTKGA